MNGKPKQSLEIFVTNSFLSLKLHRCGEGDCFLSGDLIFFSLLSTVVSVISNCTQRSFGAEPGLTENYGNFCVLYVGK